MKKKLAFAALVALTLPVAAGAVIYRAEPGLSALDKIERGQWALRSADGTSRSMCVSDPQILLQLQHRGNSCTRFVVANDGNGGRVTYDCPGVGNGATRVVVETPRLVRVESQGISRGLPFSFEYEARRTGACASHR